MRILRYVRIDPDTVRLDGVPVPVTGRGLELLSELYRNRVKDYPKFFKMDLLCKLGFIAAELLVGDEPDRFVPREDRAVLLVSRTGPLCDDRNYQKTIAEDAYFPSPALFVYTLANIVTGEIAIRNKYEGDTTAYGFPSFSAETLVSVVKDAFTDRVTTSALCGWVEAPDPDHFEAILMLVDDTEGDGMEFNPENILKIKLNQR